MDLHHCSLSVWIACSMTGRVIAATAFFGSPMTGTLPHGGCDPLARIGGLQRACGISGTPRTCTGCFLRVPYAPFLAHRRGLVRLSPQARRKASGMKKKEVNMSWGWFRHYPPPIIIVNAHFFASNEKYFVHTICCVGFYRRPLLSVCFLLPHSLLLPSAPPINTAA